MIPLIINSFISFRWLDMVDILLVALLLFKLYDIIKGTVAINIFIGIIAVYFIWKLVKGFEMELLSEILGQFISVGVIALIIVFQQEIRQFLLLLGKPSFIKKGLKGFLFWNFSINKTTIFDIEPVINACKRMSASKTGALIVIAKKNELKQYIESGELINAKISQQLIENVFFKNSPLHDGAMIITDNLIRAARCVLPVTENLEFPVHLGLRHRAAMGISQESDAITIVVSEQTGEISYSLNGELHTNINANLLKQVMMKELNVQ